MARDINYSILTGEVQSTPALISIKNNKKICVFKLKVSEKYELTDGTPKEHNNFLTIEVLGKNVDRIMQEAKRGDRYFITGYYRVDDLNGVEAVRIRAFNLQRE